MSSVWNDPGQQYQPRESWWMSRPILVVLLVILVILGLVALWISFRSIDSDLDGQPIQIISAEEKPVKVKPDSPGGMIIPHTDKEVYELISPQRTNGPEVSIQQAPETPVVEHPFTASNASPMGDTISLEELSPGRGQKIFIKSDVVNLRVEENKTEIMPKPQPKKKASPAPAPKGIMVQLASLSTEKLAEREWALIKKKHWPVLKNFRSRIIKANLGKKGVFYRVQVGPLKNRTVADDVCRNVKKKGGSCFVV